MMPKKEMIMTTALSQGECSWPALSRVVLLSCRSSSISQKVVQLICAAFLFLVGGVTSVSVAETTQDQTSPASKLESVQTDHFYRLLVADSIKIPVSRKIYISDARVAFSKAWLSEFHNTDVYQKKIIKRFGSNVVENLKKSLKASGWKIMDAPGADTLQLDPRLFDLYITAPEAIGAKYTIVSCFVYAKIELVFKTPSSQPFMKIVDFRKSINHSGFEANRASNYHYFNKMMTSWSRSAVVYLEQIVSLVEKNKTG